METELKTPHQSRVVLPYHLSVERRIALWAIVILVLSISAFFAESSGISEFWILVAMAIAAAPLSLALAALLARREHPRDQTRSSTAAGA